MNCQHLVGVRRLQSPWSTYLLSFLQALPEQEKHLPDIQVINLTKNSITDLKKEIFYSARLINLQRIYLRRGKNSPPALLAIVLIAVLSSAASIENVHKTAFYKLIQLVELDLSFNFIRTIPSESFQHIPKLKALDLSYNQIEVVKNYSFLHLNSLKLLSLNG